MTTTQVNPGEVINAQPSSSTSSEPLKTTLFKTEQVELIRLALPTDKIIPEHKAPGQIIVQCLAGRVDFAAAGKTETLGPGQLLYLEAGELHSLHCLEAASVLVTKLAGK